MSPPQTESAREARKSFYCELCQKGYSRINEFEAHEGSYDHQHKKVCRLSFIFQLVKVGGCDDWFLLERIMSMRVSSCWLENEIHRSIQIFQRGTLVEFEILMPYPFICSSAQSPLFAYPGIHIKQPKPKN